MTVQDFMDLKKDERVRWLRDEIIEGTVVENTGEWVVILWDDGMRQATPLYYAVATSCVCRWIQRVRPWDNPHNRSTNGKGA